MPYLPIVLFAALFAYAWQVHGPSPYVAALYGLASAACFAIYALDKSAARRKERRTPESTLLLLGLAGGWPGAVLAQQWLRHKSSKASFRWRFHLTVVLNLAVFTWLMVLG